MRIGEGDGEGGHLGSEVAEAGVPCACKPEGGSGVS